MKYISLQQVPQKCLSTPALGNGHNNGVLITVISSPHNSKRRSDIRQTWGGECRAASNCRCIFVIGRAKWKEAEANQALLKESALEKDILQVDVWEHYNNLTLKTIHAIRWEFF